MNTEANPAGKIMLVGIGPSSVGHMTQRARVAIAETDTVIGYVTYIKLVADMAEGGATREGEKPGRSLSTGLLGWLDTLQAEHAEGLSMAELARRHRLPQDPMAAGTTT